MEDVGQDLDLVVVVVAAFFQTLRMAYLRSQ